MSKRIWGYLFYIIDAIGFFVFLGLGIHYGFHNSQGLSALSDAGYFVIFSILALICLVLFVLVLIIRLIYKSTRRTKFTF